jgi:single-stranded-DNA-specific exonuclease
MIRNWIEPPELRPPLELQETVGGHPLVASLLARRGFTDPGRALAFLDPTLYRPSPPGELPGLEAATALLQKAIRQGETICVWGDFDVDGQTATSILVSTLRELGGKVMYHIPLRERESHGVNLAGMERVIEAGAGLLLTCDTGITAHAEAGYARSRGVPFIISDHHDLPANLPQAEAVVNPKLLAPDHPLAGLPGAGVAYKLAEELLERAGRPERAAALLDLAALGIVADLAALTGDTRYLLQLGLIELRRTGRPGIQAILELAGVEAAGLTEEHIGFVLAPRLNALGRLSDANPAVELLTTGNLIQARTLAYQLEGLNARRKLLTDQVFQAALTQIEREPGLLDEAALVLSHPAWPGGVLGLVAGRLVERFNRPALALTCPPGEVARGSARSVPGCNITAAIAAQAELLIGFGGHPMAAGLALDPERIPEFRRRLSKTVAEMCAGSRQPHGLQIDALLPLAAANLELAEELERLAPFGSGNPPLTLAAANLTFKSQATLGRSGEHLAITVSDEAGQDFRLVWWGGGGWPRVEGRFDLAYRLRASSYRGTRQAQLEWAAARPIEAAAVELKSRPAIQVVDLRRMPQPLALLKDITSGRESAEQSKQDAIREDREREQAGTQIWREGEAAERLGEQGVNGCDRLELAAGAELIIWTSPPGPQELRAALECVSPEIVYLFGVRPATETPEALLKRLAGLAKYAVRTQAGVVSLERLAASTAQRTAAVRAGLTWLEGTGHLALLEEAGDRLLIGAGTGPGKASSPDSERIYEILKAILAESAAFRDYFATAAKDSLLDETLP